MITPAIVKIRAAVLAEFADEISSGKLVSAGIYNRRRMRRFWLWSQHAWGNAWDVKVAVSERHRGGAGDRLKVWLLAEHQAGRLPVERVLWRIVAHYDHLHIVGKPRMRGTPPLTGTQEDIDMEELKEVVTGIQTSLMAAGYDLPQWGADGVWGPETAGAHAKMVKDAATMGIEERAHYHDLADKTGRSHRA